MVPCSHGFAGAGGGVLLSCGDDDGRCVSMCIVRAVRIPFASSETDVRVFRRWWLPRMVTIGAFQAANAVVMTFAD